MAGDESSSEIGPTYSYPNQDQLKNEAETHNPVGLKADVQGRVIGTQGENDVVQLPSGEQIIRPRVKPRV